MITKYQLIKEIAQRIVGIKPGQPASTDFLISELVSLLVLANALPEQQG